MSAALHDCRNAFADELLRLARENPDIVAVCNDSIGSSKLGEFQKSLPGRIVNVGIAEQNMVGVAAGLANGGKIPFVCAASCFLTGRALEQIKADIAYSNANVKLCGMSAGMAYGALGPTHHSIEDFAWTRVIANLAVVAPADPTETTQAVRWAAHHKGPVFFAAHPHGGAGGIAAEISILSRPCGGVARRRRCCGHRQRRFGSLRDCGGGYAAKRRCGLPRAKHGIRPPAGRKSHHRRRRHACGNCDLRRTFHIRRIRRRRR